MFGLLHSIAVIGFSLTRYGSVLETQVTGYDAWWGLLCFSSFYNLMHFVRGAYWWIKFMVSKRQETKDFKKEVGRRYRTAEHITMTMISFVKAIAYFTLPFVLLFTNEVGTHDALRYTSACTVILTCFELMLAFSRLPNVGIYIFMLQKVFFSILRFFASYMWHFLGYAIAFHLLMPKDGGAFANLGDSFIKVSKAVDQY